MRILWPVIIGRKGDFTCAKACIEVLISVLAISERTRLMADLASFVLLINFIDGEGGLTLQKHTYYT